MQLPAVLNFEVVDDGVDYRLHLAAEHPCFDGHFPNHPVLAGIVQMHWAIAFARRHWPQLTTFTQLEAVKFQHLIPAGQTVALTLKLDRARAKVHFRYSSDRGAHSSGRVVFAEAEVGA